MITTIEAGKFSARSELENHVRGKYGLTPENKPDVKIQGTEAELARLQLSDSSLFWGIRCAKTMNDTTGKTVEDTSAKIETQEKPDRGPKFKSGIDLQDNK